eukprot:symbB.v1.2.036514.t1/scaffold5029.1/size31658/1
MLKEFGKPSFQRDIAGLKMAANSNSRRVFDWSQSISDFQDPEGYFDLEGRDDLALIVQKGILPGFGFEASKEGVQEMMHHCAPFFQDPEVAEVLDAINTKLGMTSSASKRFRALWSRSVGMDLGNEASLRGPLNDTWRSPGDSVSTSEASSGPSMAFPHRATSLGQTWFAKPWISLPTFAGFEFRKILRTLERAQLRSGFDFSFKWAFHGIPHQSYVVGPNMVCQTLDKSVLQAGRKGAPKLGDPMPKLYHLTLQRSSAITHAIYGNFSAPKAQEIVCARYKTLELLRPDDSGKVQSILSVEIFGVIRALNPFRLTGASRDYIVVASDSGRIVILEYDGTKNMFEKVHQETFGKTGCRRIVPGQYLAVDPKGRAVMIGAIEKQKFVGGPMSSEGI